jgi:2'-5' RNA ligase
MYFIALVLPSALNEKLLHWKNFMLQRYDCKVGLKSPAHITLIPPFWMEENREAELFHDVAQLAKNSLPFIVRTKSFSAFKPRTIFIDVEKNIALNSLKENVDDFFKPNNSYKIKIDSRPFHPHITIATRDLFKKGFYEAWAIFEKESFEEGWIADGLSVLSHNKKNWDVVYTSQFIVDSKP